MAGFFKQLDRHRRRLPKELEQYDDEYLRYCVEKDLVETVLESTLHETDDPKEISDLTLKTVCDFYGGDWSGVMDIDMDTCLWRPVCWFRAGGANDTTLERLSGLEDAEVMPRWLESMKSASPIVLTDTSEIRESCPVEYALYERLDARSIIASPFSPSPTGFLVIRNPSRYSKYDYKNKDTDNSRNGHSNKTLRTSFGDVAVSVPRDRKGAFEPQVLKKARRKILCKRFSTKSRILLEQLSSRLPWPLKDQSLRQAGLVCAPLAA